VFEGDPHEPPAAQEGEAGTALAGLLEPPTVVHEGAGAPPAGDDHSAEADGEPFAGEPVDQVPLPPAGDDHFAEADGEPFPGEPVDQVPLPPAGDDHFAEADGEPFPGEPVDQVPLPLTGLEPDDQ
jgi:hypothetical protein